MYFTDREEAGQLLSKRLKRYKTEPTEILTLTAGGVLVGEYIAKNLAAEVFLLLTRDIGIPGEPDPIGTMAQTGEFTYNSELPRPEIDAYVSEFHNHIEAQKMSKLFELNKATGRHKIFDRHKLHDKNIIVASDGLKHPGLIDAVYQYLKPIKIKRLVAAVPIATVNVVDRLHVFADEIHVLSVLDNTVFEIDHYYTDNEIPSEEVILNRIDHLAKA